jgi:hypothetical protein
LLAVETLNDEYQMKDLVAPGRSIRIVCLFFPKVIKTEQRRRPHYAVIIARCCAGPRRTAHRSQWAPARLFYGAERSWGLGGIF